MSMHSKPRTLLLVAVVVIMACDGGNGDIAQPPEAGQSFTVDAGGLPEQDGAESPDVWEAAAWPDGKYISIEEVHARLLANDMDMLLVNVVDEEFYDLGQIEGSLTIPWDTLEGRIAELDPARHIVIYCRRGVRSEVAYTTLAEHELPFVWVMEGGIESWIASGYPTVEL